MNLCLFVLNKNLMQLQQLRFYSIIAGKIDTDSFKININCAIDFSVSKSGPKAKLFLVDSVSEV